MSNKIYSKEKVAIVGIFKVNGEVCTDGDIVCLILDASDHFIKEEPMTLDTETRTYSFFLDTVHLKGEIKLRFAAIDAEGDRVYSDNIIRMAIYPAIATDSPIACKCKCCVTMI